MKFLVDHPFIKWLMVIVAIIGIVLGYKWHIDEEKLAIMESKWLEQDVQWNEEIISRLVRIEEKLGNLDIK